MSFEVRGESIIGAHDLDELKVVFRTLHGCLADRPELMDTHFLLELQRLLHRLAREQGVDVADHAAWDRWLGNGDAASCETRATHRRTIDPP